MKHKYPRTTTIVGALLLTSCSPEPRELAPSVDEDTSVDVQMIAASSELAPTDCPDLGSCTANDVVTTVVSAQELGGDDCADGYLDVQWTFEFTSTANERFDLGVFVATDGVAVPDSSSCEGVAPQAGDGDGNTNPDLDDDLFVDLDPHDDGDTCGDLSAVEGPVQMTVSATVACTDVTDTGELTVQSCRVWQQNANHKEPCTDLASAGTGSKCDCDPVVLHVDPCSLVICDDGLYCNGQEACDSSSGVAVCQAGTPQNCDDGVACTDDSCNEGTDSCDNIANNGNCDDGLYCNGNETCDPSSGCQAGTPVVCGDGASCTTDVCDEATDSCQSTDNGLCATLAPAGSGCSCTCAP